MINVCGAVSFDGTEVRQSIAGPMVESRVKELPSLDVRWWTGDGAAFATMTHREPSLGPSVIGRVLCLADARIDNSDEIASALGVPSLRDATAAHVILAAHRRWGPSCAEHLVGDYAFVLWDIDARTLFAARDAMGARTLFHRTVDRRHTIIATELRQLLAVPGVPRVPNETALVADVAGLYALPPMTPFAGIAQLGPGCALRVDREGARTWQWHQVDPAHRIRYRDQRAYADHLRTLLERSVEARLSPRRPTGMFLSGGLDSMSTVATAAQIAGPRRDRLHAYSWAFDELIEGDERQTSKVVSEAYDLTVTDVPADDLWPLRDHREHPPDLDEPYSWLYQRLIERTVAAAHDDDAGVLLTSDRGDEMTGNWVRDDLGLLLAGRLPSLVADARRSGAGGIRGTRSYTRQHLIRPALRTIWPPHSYPQLRLALEARTGRPHHVGLPPWVPADAARRFDLPAVIAAAEAKAPIRNHARRERHASAFHVMSLRVAQLRRRTWAKWGPTYADPWGDRRIAEFVCAIPQWRLQRFSRPKLLAQQAMQGIIPDQVRRNPSRAAPVGLFRRAFDDREVSTVHRLLDDSRASAAGWLDAEAVRESFESYRRGEDQAHDFWHPLCVEMWLRAWWD